MSDLRLSANLNTPKVTGQAKKPDDSFDCWKGIFTDFMGKFGERLNEATPRETYSSFLQELQKAAKREGKEAQLAEFLKGFKKPPAPQQPKPQMVNAGQVLAMQKRTAAPAPQVTPQTGQKEAPADTGKSPIPTGAEIGQQDGWFEGWDDGSEKTKNAAPAQQQVNVPETRKKPEYPQGYAPRPKPTIDGIETIGTGQVQKIQTNNAPAAAKPAEGSEKVYLTPEDTVQIRDKEPVTAKPAEAPVAKPAEAPVAKPAEAPVAKPAEAPVAKPAEAPVAKHAAAPVTAKPTEAKKDVPYEETITGRSEEALQKCFGDKAVQEILSLLIPEDAGMSEGNTPQVINDVVSLRKMLTGTPGKSSDYVRICTADARSPITKSRITRDEVKNEFTETLSGSLSDYMDREEVERGIKTPEEIEARKAENRREAEEERKAIIEKAEDEIIIDFIKKYKRPDGTLDPNAYKVMSSLRNKGLIPDNHLLELTKECITKDGKPDAAKVNAICVLKQAGALTDEVLPVLDLIPPGKDSKYDKDILQDAADLTKAGIGLPELGELMELVKDKPFVKDAITAVSPYYPHQKAQLKELVPLMIDKDGNEDPGAATIVKDMAETVYPKTQKLPAERPEHFKTQEANINAVTNMTKSVIEAAKDDGSPTVNPIAAVLVSIMSEFNTKSTDMTEIIDGCKDNEGKINENLSNIAANLVEIGVDQDTIVSYLDKFMYKDGRVDNAGAKAEAEFLSKETETLRQTNETIKQLQAQADNIRKKLQQRFN